MLVKITINLDQRLEDASPMEKRAFERQVRSLVEELPALPDFSRFHAAFRPYGEEVPAGDLRSAFFLAYDESKCEYLLLEGTELDEVMASGRELVSTSFVIPYPPGFPILVPGQVVSTEIIDFMRKLDVKEIHGYRPELGLRVFTEQALQEELAGPSATAKKN